MTSKDDFEIHRSDQFLFQKVKITLMQYLTEEKLPLPGVRNVLLLNLSSELQAFQTNFTCAVFMESNSAFHPLIFIQL